MKSEAAIVRSAHEYAIREINALEGRRRLLPEHGVGVVLGGHDPLPRPTNATVELVAVPGPLPDAADRSPAMNSCKPERTSD